MSTNPQNLFDTSQKRATDEQPHIVGAKNMVSSPTSGERYVSAENKPRLSSFTNNRTTTAEDTDIDEYSTANRTLKSFSSAEVPTNSLANNLEDDTDDDDLQIISIREEDDDDEDYVEGPQRRKSTKKKKTARRTKNLPKTVPKPRAPLKLEKVSLPRFSSNIDLETIEKNKAQAGRLTRASSSLLQKFDVRRDSSTKGDTKEVEEIIISDSENEFESPAKLRNNYRLMDDVPSSPLTPQNPDQDDPSHTTNILAASANNEGPSSRISRTDQFKNAKLQRRSKEKYELHNGKSQSNDDLEKLPNSGHVVSDTEKKPKLVNDFGLNLEDVDISESDDSDNESMNPQQDFNSQDKNLSKTTKDDQHADEENGNRKTSFSKESRTASLSPTPQNSITPRTEFQAKSSQEKGSANILVGNSGSKVLNKELQHSKRQNKACIDDGNDDIAFLDDDDDDDDFFFGDYIKNEEPKQKVLDSPQKAFSSFSKPPKKEKFQAKGRTLHLPSTGSAPDFAKEGAEKEQFLRRAETENDALKKLLLEDDLLQEIESERNSKIKRSRTTEGSFAKKSRNDSFSAFHAEDDLLLQTAKKFKKASKLTDLAALKRKITRKRMYMLLIVSKIPELKDKSIEVKVYGDQNFDHIIPNVLHSLFNFYEMPELENIYFKEDLVLYHERVKLQYFMTLDSLGIPETSADELTEVRIDLVLKKTAESKDSKVLESIMEDKNKTQLPVPKKQLNAADLAQLKLMTAWEAELNLEKKEESPVVAQPQRSASPNSFVIYLVGSDNKKLKANVTNATKMKSLAAYYRKEKAFAESIQITFSFDNEEIPQESTVGELDMEEDDMLEVITN
ncbi:hypothetical protein ACO0QE_004553 [Hanseniaspora vineae]